MNGYDMTIAGAGPAGSVLALLAARARYRVLLVEKSHFDRPRFGETTPPELRPVLTRVGLERLAHAPFCREAPEVLSVWGTYEPRSRHHIFSPYGPALHLDRRAFDEALALAARDAGADLKLGCTARFTAQPRGGYMVQLSTGERFFSNAAILATGRAGGGLGLPYVRQYLDNNVAVAARLSSPLGHLDPRTIVEAVPGGWFYLAALPGNQVIAVFITLATLVPSKRRARLRWWVESLAQTTVVRHALNRCRLPKTVLVIDARASFARGGAGERWLAIGDARIAPDPLSGQGIIWAIDDALSVMELLTRMGWHDLADEMGPRTMRDVKAYRVERSRVYLSERRFKDEAYWRASQVMDFLPLHATATHSNSRLCNPNQVSKVASKLQPH
jgi:flavin-dependent dehydrogenase